MANNFLFLNVLRCIAWGHGVGRGGDCQCAKFASTGREESTRRAPEEADYRLKSEQLERHQFWTLGKGQVDRRIEQVDDRV